MMKRIFKMLLAQGASTVITLITQLLVPPMLIHYYGVREYGEWLVLSATITYLSTLNFGITTYSSNELTMMRQRGEMDAYRQLQASTLMLILGLAGIGTLISLGITLMPLTKLLHLHTITASNARIIALFLGLQMMAHIIGGYYNNLFMVVQETHRGTMWYNWRRLSAVVVVVPFAILHASFPVIAAGQFVAVLGVMLATIIDLRKRMHGLPLGLRGASWTVAKPALKPSGMFAMVFMQTFLVFQVPVILLQRLLGAELVVVFTISRTILATARQILSALTNAIAPEITLSYGSRDKKKLLDIYHYSECIVFATIPTANLGALLFSPLLLRIWVHKPELFDPGIYALMALISGMMSIREHKQFFQFSTNQHYKLAHIVFWGNIIMILASIPAVLQFGVLGFMWMWLISEVTQTGLLYFENRQLFDCHSSISIRPILKLFLIMAIFVPFCLFIINYAKSRTPLVLTSYAFGATLLIMALSYAIFGVDAVRSRMLSSLQQLRT